MKKILLIALAMLSLVACENKSKEQKLYKTCFGTIIGTFGCYDKQDNPQFHKGYLIKTYHISRTNYSDIVLSFDIDVQDSIDVPYGITMIDSIDIPYIFKIHFLLPTNSNYVDFAIPIEYGTQQTEISVKSIEQVQVEPIEPIVLMGYWSDEYNIDNTPKTSRIVMHFDDSNDVIYKVLPIGANQSALLSSLLEYEYDGTPEKGNVRFHNSYIKDVYPDSTTFDFTTGYTREGLTLTLDSFSYDGGINDQFIKPLVMRFFEMNEWPRYQSKRRD